MRAVVRRVHPDLFAAHPYERAKNTESLKVGEALCGFCLPRACSVADAHAASHEHATLQSESAPSWRLPVTKRVKFALAQDSVITWCSNPDLQQQLAGTVLLQACQRKTSLSHPCVTITLSSPRLPVTLVASALPQVLCGCAAPPPSAPEGRLSRPAAGAQRLCGRAGARRRAGGRARRVLGARGRRAGAPGGGPAAARLAGAAVLCVRPNLRGGPALRRGHVRHRCAAQACPGALVGPPCERAQARGRSTAPRAPRSWAACAAALRARRPRAGQARPSRSFRLGRARRAAARAPRAGRAARAQAAATPTFWRG